MKTQIEGATIVLIAPVWRLQPWFPVLLSIIIDYPNTSTAHSRPSDPFSELRLSSEGQSPTSGRLEGIRRHLASRKISIAATKLILASWRDKTNTNYNLAWRKWEKWCREQGIPPFAADVSAVLSFLTHEFEKGKQYRSVAS